MGITALINAALRAGGQEPKKEVEAQPIEEFGALHERIAASSHGSGRAASDLCTGLAAVIRSGSESERARALLAVELLDSVRKLGYSDYRMILGAINSCRDDPSGQALTQLFDPERQAKKFGPLSVRVDEVVTILKHLHGAQFAQRNANLPAPLGHDGVDAALNDRFAEQAMLLLRSVHPLGVNIRNPSWRSSDGVVAYPAGKLLGLQLGGGHGYDDYPDRSVGTLIVKPRDDTSVVKFIPYGSRWEEVTDSAVIKNGGSVVVGRALSLANEILGVTLPEPVKMHVDLTIDGAVRAWSRGSFLLYRSEDGDGLIILDRGTRRSVLSPDALGAIQSYIPRSIVKDGAISYGDSMIGRRRIE